MLNIPKDNEGRIELAILIGEIKELLDQGITEPDEIAAKVNKPVDLVNDCLEVIGMVEKAKQN